MLTNKLERAFLIELKNELGYNIFSEVNNLMKKIIQYISINLVIFMLLSKIYLYSGAKNFQKVIDENKIEYSAEIEEYNKSIEKYSEYINSLNLTHLQIIMKVMSDQWEQYKYCVDEDLKVGYYRLSFQEKGYGVCTSFADDFTAKMNAINPKYEAKNVICNMLEDDDTNEVKIVDLERNVIEVVTDIDKETKLRLSIRKKLLNLGNHAVTMIKIPDEDYYLIVDSTNLMIGLIKNGKIHVFNSNDSEIIEYDKNGNILMGGKDFVSKKDTFYSCDETYNELNEIYGYEEQSEALEYVEQLEEYSGYTRTLKKEAN